MRDPISLLGFGMRFGIPLPVKYSDFGIKVYKTGIISDLRIPFIANPPFFSALDIEMDNYQYQYLYTSFSAALIEDLELTSFIDIFLTAKWRYPAVQEIDSASLPVSGVAFLPAIGMELFRKNSLSLLLEAGLVMSWSTHMLAPYALAPYASGMISYKI